MTEKNRTATEFHEALLRTTVGHGALSINDEGADELLFHTNIRLVVSAYQAARFLAALEEHIPADTLAALLKDVQATLDDGALPEYAWDDAVAAGFDPAGWGREVLMWASKVRARGSEARS